MIVSHKHKFIFIKTTKTAGTSIEVDLNKILGDKDIATPIYPPEPGHTPQNYEYRKWGLFKKQMANHMDASEVKAIIGNKIFNDYFVFCVEREPIDKCISHYSMLKNSPTHNNGNDSLSLEDYIAQRNFPIDDSKYTDKSGKLIVNRILHYENLADELLDVAKTLGFNLELKAKAKSGFRKPIELSQEQKEIIYKSFESSNIHTGYSL